MNSLYAKGGGAVQIAEQIAARIKDGALRPGELLPPVRQLAAELEVNPNTVASAYARLRDAGLVATRGRAGTVVLEPPLAAVIGFFAYDFIKTVLFETPQVVCIALIVGGVILLFVDRIAPPPVIDDAAQIPFRKALAIGFIQCLAMIPGVSRSGSTIVGALMLGVGKRAAAEFSFFLSMPTMAAAVAYDLYKNRDVLDASALGDIAVGFIMAFIAAVVVVRWLLGYVSRRGYALFGWWRIIVGLVAIAALSAGF